MRDPPGRCYISLMFAGDASSGATSVAPHAGPTNHRLRVHLPLILPPSAATPTSTCGIRVGGVTRNWELGRCLILDDSFEHAVDLRAPTGAAGTAAAPPSEDPGAPPCRRQPEARVLVVADVWHPDAEQLCPSAKRLRG
jgi:aspartyl/asparaginyl beta-hydroxylase (cupin superfamily)